MARYEEIAAHMREQIAAGKWPVGTRLPSISELQVEYDVPRSLNTIRRAQQILVGEGLLRTQQGAGAWVIGVPPTGPRDVLGELEAARDAITRAITALQGPAGPASLSGQQPGDDNEPGDAPEPGESEPGEEPEAGQSGAPR